MDNLKPGFYENDPTYRSWQACCHTHLKEMDKSALHCFSAMHKEAEATAAQAFGSRVHRAFFYGMRQFHVWEGGDRRRTAVKEKYDSLIAEYGAENVISADEAHELALIIGSLESNLTVKSLFVKKPKIEPCLIWNDNGVLCKGQPDIYVADENAELFILADLKTTKDASPESIAAAAFNFNYYTQLAFYRRGLRAVDQRVEDALLICVESEEPYGVTVGRVLDEVLDFGDRKIDKWLKDFKAAQDSGEWRGYPDRITDISLPLWAIKKMENV